MRPRNLLLGGHQKGTQIRLENALKGVAIPLHPGALDYYREQGLVTGSESTTGAAGGQDAPVE